MSNHAIKDEAKHHFYLRDPWIFFCGDLRFFVKAYFQVWSERIHHLWPLLNQEKSAKQKNEGQKSAKEFQQFDYIFGVKIQTVYYYHATLVFIYSNLSTLIMIYHHAINSLVYIQYGFEFFSNILVWLGCRILSWG